MEATIPLTKSDSGVLSSVTSSMDQEEMLYYGIIAFAGLTLLVGSAMLANAIIGGAFIAVSILILAAKSKTYHPKLWNTVCDHPLITDIVLSLGIMGFMATGAGITVFIASSFAAILASFALKKFASKDKKVLYSDGSYDKYRFLSFFSKKEIKDEQQKDSTTTCHKDTSEVARY